jgi:hypothetical protein
MESTKNRTPLILWPLVAIWTLIARIVGLTGRFLAIVLGLVLMLVGVLVSLTIIGAVIGVPFFVIGALLVVRGLW